MLFRVEQEVSYGSSWTWILGYIRGKGDREPFGVGQEMGWGGSWEAMVVCW